MREKGFVLPLILVIVALATVISVALFFGIKQKINPQQESLKKVASREWIGLLRIKEGFVKINAQGVLEKDSGSKLKTLVPPGLKIEEISRLELLEDGRIVFVGSPDIFLAQKVDTVYFWLIDSPGSSKPLFKITEGQKIQSFAMSSDYRNVAIGSVTRTSSETLEGLEGLSFGSDEFKKVAQEREKQLQEESRTITIYDINSSKVIQTLKLKLMDPPSRRTGAPGLIWRKNRLFAEDIYEITVFDSSTWENLGTVKNDESITGPLQPSTIVISPDGTKYYNITTLEVRSIPENKLITRLNVPEFITLQQVNENTGEDKIVHPGLAAFSLDSKKIIIEGTSLGETYFVIWEMDLESGVSKKVGDFYSLDYESLTERTKLINDKKGILFIDFTPSDEKIIFSVYSEKEHTKSRLDFFSLKLGEEKTQYHHNFAEVSGFPDLGNISFLGWYLSQSE